MHGQWKLFCGQWKVREKSGICFILMGGNPEETSGDAE